jgi:SRSO17 transposase
VATAQQWAGGREAVATRIRARFPRTELRQRATASWRGLIRPIERQNGWQLAEAAGAPTPYGGQQLLGRAAWRAEAVRDDLRAYVVAHVGAADAVLVVDATGCVKKGAKSVGVARQSAGPAGRVEHCHIGVLRASATQRARTCLDRALYLPRQWATAAARRAAAGGPAAIGFATKPPRARRLRARALAGGGPGAWLTGDAVDGHDWRMRAWLADGNLHDGLGVTAQSRMFTGEAREWAATVGGRRPPTAWQRHSCGAGSQGERVYAWARMPRRQRATARPRGLWARRHVSAPTKSTSDVASGPQETPLDAWARVAGRRWAIEESVEPANGAVGLDPYEVRRWQGWSRQMTLARLAHA